MKDATGALPLTKYIRVTGDINAAFVEFDFAIHDPTLYVELVLPAASIPRVLRNQSSGGNERTTASRE